MTIEITKADLGSKEHAEAVLDLLDAYSRDAMGAGKPLDRHKPIDYAHL